MKPALDYLFAHSDDLQEVVGNFHGFPIIRWSPSASEQRIDTEIAANVAAERVYQENQKEAGQCV